MYQASIRDKKKHQKFHNVRLDNYELNSAYEEYAYVKKILGNCRVLVITNSGIEAIGIIRGSLRKFNNRVIIESGDIVVVSKRDYQTSKVDIVHKYNSDQIQSFINDKRLSNILSNYYNNKSSGMINDVPSNDDNYIDFGDISDNDSDKEDNNINEFKIMNLNGKYDKSSDDDVLDISDI
jgi:translation initiation factor 1A